MSSYVTGHRLFTVYLLETNSFICYPQFHWQLLPACTLFNLQWPEMSSYVTGHRLFTVYLLETNSFICYPQFHWQLLPACTLCNLFLYLGFYVAFRVLYCKLPTNSKQLPAFPLEAVPVTEPWPHRWEARVLPLCHRDPLPLHCRWWA